MTRRGHPSIWRRLAVRLYRIALLRYPRRLRRRHGEEMVEAFQRLVDQEGEGLSGAWRVAARILRDLMRPVPGPVGGRPRPGPGAFSHGMSSAFRSLRRAPGFTALTVGVLGVAVAFNVAVLTVVNAYLLRPLPFPEPGRLVQVRPATAAVGTENSGDVFEKAVSWNLDGFTLVGDGTPEVVLGARVTPDFFDVFGVAPALGRGFDADETLPGGASAVLISHALWMRRYGGDPGVLGRTLRAYPADAEDDVESFTVVGVLPAGFWYLNGYTEVLAPLPGGGPVYTGRLRSDVPPERAAELLTARVVAASDVPRPEGFRVQVRSLQEAYVSSLRPKLLTVQAAAFLVLLVGCANAGLLLLVRAAGRRRELGVRQALGAGRRRLAAHVLWEGLMLALAAGAVGVGASSLALSAAGPLIQARLGRAVPGGMEALQVDPTVLLTTLGACALVGLAFGSVPLWAWRRDDLVRLIRSGDRGMTEGAGPRRLRGALVAAEVALSLTLLTGAGLLVRSAVHLSSAPLGFEPRGLAAYTVGLTTPGSESEARRLAFFRALEERARDLPGVVSAGVVRGAPFASALVTREVETEDGAQGAVPLEAVPQVASPGYFAALGLSAVLGRTLVEEDRAGTRPTVVVSTALASLLWPDGAPLGRRMRFTEWTMPDMSEEVGPWLTVVGVVPDVGDTVEGVRPTAYVPHAQAALDWMTLVVRRRPGVADVTQEVHGILAELDPEVPVYDAAEIPAAVARAREPSRFFAGLLGGFSVFSLAMAVLGLYGVAAYAARQRRRDVAVRMALGAGRGAVQRLFLLQGTGPVLIGLAVGMAGGRFLGLALRDQLHGVSPEDPSTALGVAALLGVTALVAAWLPARRAARADPMGVLREE